MRSIRFSRVLIFATFVGLSGCSESLTLRVDSEVPDALVQKLPLAVGVYYDQTFSNYRYIEDTEERPAWDISSGAAQVATFDRVLGSMFSQVERLSTAPVSGAVAAHDVSITPSIVEMQFATPGETGFEFFEAWIHYRITLLNRDGTQDDRWEIAAYGKAPVKRFMARTDGLNEAIRFALRDVGAKLSTGLPERALIERALAPSQRL